MQSDQTLPSPLKGQNLKLSIRRRLLLCLLACIVIHRAILHARFATAVGIISDELHGYYTCGTNITSNYIPNVLVPLAEPLVFWLLGPFAISEVEFKSVMVDVGVVEIITWPLTDRAADRLAVAVDALGYCPRIVLIGSPLTDEGLKSLSNVKGLTELWLVGSNITDSGVIQLVQQNTSLTTLVVSNTGVSDDSVDAICKSKLEVVDVSGTDVSQEGVARLRARIAVVLDDRELLTKGWRAPKEWNRQPENAVWDWGWEVIQ